jgi:hypothetical protein
MKVFETISFMRLELFVGEYPNILFKNYFEMMCGLENIFSYVLYSSHSMVLNHILNAHYYSFNVVYLPHILSFGEMFNFFCS